MYETDCHNVLCSLTQFESCCQEGLQNVRTVDADVDVMAIATVNNIKPDELCVAFVAGVHFSLQST